MSTTTADDYFGPGGEEESMPFAGEEEEPYTGEEDEDMPDGAEDAGISMQVERWRYGPAADGTEGAPGVPGLAGTFSDDVLGGSNTANYAVKFSGDSREAVEEYIEDHLSDLVVEGAPITEDTAYVGDEALVRDDEYLAAELADLDRVEWDDDGNAYILGEYTVADEQYGGLLGGFRNAASDAGQPPAQLRVTAVDDVEDGPGQVTQAYEEEPGKSVLDFLSDDVASFGHGVDTNSLLFGRSPGTTTTETHNKGMYERFREHHKEEPGMAAYAKNSLKPEGNDMVEAIIAAMGLDAITGRFGR